MNKFPEGWTTVPLGEIALYIQRGKSPRYVEESVLPVINQKCIRWWGIDTRFLKFVHPDQWGAWADERFVRGGDILWNSTGTGTIGRACLFRSIYGYEKAVVDSHVTIVRLADGIDEDYVFRFIQSPSVQNRIEELHTGSTNQVELSKSAVAGIAVPLAPLPEQHRIVAKLDSLFERTRRAREELSHIPRLIENYKKAILEAAFRGDLTKDWRCVHGITSTSWKKRKIDEVLIRIRAGKNLRCEERPPNSHEKGVVKVSAVTWGYFDPIQSKTLPDNFSPPSDTLIQKGDFLFSGVVSPNPRKFCQSHCGPALIPLGW